MIEIVEVSHILTGEYATSDVLGRDAIDDYLLTLVKTRVDESYHDFSVSGLCR